LPIEKTKESRKGSESRSPKPGLRASLGGMDAFVWGFFQKGSQVGLEKTLFARNIKWVSI